MGSANAIPPFPGQMALVGDRAVAVAVDDHGAPSLRKTFIAGLVVNSGTNPPEHVSVAAEPQRVVIVLGEDEVVRSEACPDKRHVISSWIVYS